MPGATGSDVQVAADVKVEVVGGNIVGVGEDLFRTDVNHFPGF